MKGSEDSHFVLLSDVPWGVLAAVAVSKRFLQAQEVLMQPVLGSQFNVE